jgi:hypothetical protein
MNTKNIVIVILIVSALLFIKRDCTSLINAGDVVKEFPSPNEKDFFVKANEYLVKSIKNYDVIAWDKGYVVIFKLQKTKLIPLYYPEKGITIDGIVKKHPEKSIIINGCFYNLNKKFDLNGAVLIGGKFDKRGPVPDAQDYRMRGWKHGNTVKDNRSLFQYKVKTGDPTGGYAVAPGQPPEDAENGIGGLLWALDLEGKKINMRYKPKSYGLVAFDIDSGTGVIILLERTKRLASGLIISLENNGADFAVYIDGGPSLALSVDGKVLIKGGSHTKSKFKKPVSQYIQFIQNK